MEVAPGYKQTEVGVIPEDWKVSPVGLAFDICNNLRLPISQAVRKGMAGPYPYYGPTAIQGYINEYRVEGEYALIGEDGDHFLKWQDQSMTQLVSGRFNVNNHAHLVKGVTNHTSWFYYFFSHRDLTPYLTRQGAGRYKLTKATLVRIPCALPPTKAEQQVIAEALSDADALIQSLEQLLTKKRHLKQGAMQELLTGKKRLPGFSGKWEVKRLGEVLTIRHGKSQRSVEVSNGTYPILATGGQIGAANQFLYDKPSVLIGRKGTIDHPQFMDTPFWTVDTLFYSEIHDPNNAKFLYYRFWLIDWSQHNEASGVPSLNAKTIERIEIEIPQPQEQTAIAAILSDMDVEIVALEARLDKARNIKQGMMQELLTGRIRLV